MGKLSIPVLDSSWPIIHGTGDEELDRGSGISMEVYSLAKMTTASYPVITTPSFII
ncbi:hypothetical protein JCM19047_1152 [Bacillus sp. JCM 19047]|nr:hypothetical protein JCM19047_1152 [Bacillus sp. JCM 19047]